MKSHGETRVGSSPAADDFYFLKYYLIFQKYIIKIENSIEKMKLDAKVDSSVNKFLKLNLEKKEFNQYWFSEKTIEFIVNQIISNTKSEEKMIEKNSEIFSENLNLSLSENIEVPKKIAVVACPSVFFSLPKEIQDHSFLFDIDANLIKKHKNGVIFDFNEFSGLDKSFYNFFDFILIDPPFIVKEVWEKFAEFATLIKKDKAKILTCSIFENSEMLKNLLNLNIQEYQPSIPHLVYQYNFYSNYEDEQLKLKNSELLG